MNGFGEKYYFNIGDKLRCVHFYAVVFQFSVFDKPSFESLSLVDIYFVSIWILYFHQLPISGWCWTFSYCVTVLNFNLSDNIFMFYVKVIQFMPKNIHYSFYISGMNEMQKNQNIVYEENIHCFWLKMTPKILISH